MTTKHFISFFITLVISVSLHAQGLEIGELSSNPVLVSKWQQMNTERSVWQASITDTINLDTVKGLLDDFSYDRVYPDTALWLNNKVFINRGYAKSPITLGTATFDGLDANGYPYNFMATSGSSGAADTLTSKPINLRNYVHNGNMVNYLPSDSLYFSFYYQPQGWGNAPESNDSLVLEFTSSLLTSWLPIWSQRGSALAATDSSWKLVMIPVKDLQYLQKGFQFRFRNYATLSGNVDHWHIDYVYLNKYRHRNDTLFEDMTFVYNTPSMLHTYSAMPWKHYDTTFMKDYYATTIRNNYSLQKNTNYHYKIYDESGGLVHNSPLTASDNIDPFWSNGYNNKPFAANPELMPFFIPSLTDTTHYTIESILYTNPDKHRNNDTIKHRQQFYNYYAYDDGTAESALYLSVLNASIANKFTSTIGDTLKCIDIYFNPVLTDASLYAIELKVWSEGAGVPGTLLYQSDTIVTPMYAQTGHDHFTHYYLDPPLYLPAGAFYIGFTQKTDQQLNVGFDRNINSQSKIYYNLVTPSWNTSSYTGSLMMRPVFGVADFYAGLQENAVITKRANTITVYPNPANDKLYITTAVNNPEEKLFYSIIDMYGRTVAQNKVATLEYIDIAELTEGIYFIRVVSGNKVSTVKFVKVN